jgi:protein-disulfide isomerase
MPNSPPARMLVGMRGRLFLGMALAACVLGGGLIATSVFGATREAPKPTHQAPANDTAALLAGIPQDGAALGRRDAPVTLVEFADLQCPYCAQWSSVAFDDIVDEYVRPGKVRLVFSGLAFVGPDSEWGLRFALAAGRQGGLWDVVHRLYANQGVENGGWLSDDMLRDVGGSISSLRVEKAFADAASPAVAHEIAAAQKQAAELGIQGTPSFAAGRTGGRLRPIPIMTLDPDGLRSALDSLLADA